MTQAADRASPFRVHTRGNPSISGLRVIVAILCVLGAAVSLRLAAYQLGWAPAPWEPFFGDGSRRVLESSFSRSLPFPDAAAGVVAYLTEAVLVLVSGRARTTSRAWLVYAYGAVAAGMALGSAGLVAMQALVVHAFCTLCLVSAALSLGLVVPAYAEVFTCWKARRTR